MGIRNRVTDALLLFENGRHEGAFLNALVAVAATARRASHDPHASDRECFESFLDNQSGPKISVEYRGECHKLSHILYKWLRCELVHEGGVPIDIEFIDSNDCVVRAGGAPEYILQLSLGWFRWLIRSVVQAPCNLSRNA